MIELVVTVLIWGLSFAIAKKALGNFHPLELSSLRLLIGGVTSLLISKFFFKSKVSLRGIFSRSAMILGFFEFGATYALYTWSLSYLPSGIVGMLTLLVPMLTLWIGVGMRAQKFTWRIFLATILSVLGAAFCFPIDKILGDVSVSREFILGFILIMASNVCFAVGNVLISKWNLKSNMDTSLTGQGLLFGGIFVGALCFLTSNFTPAHFMSGEALIIPIYLGVVATGLGFFLWNRGVQKVTAVPATLVGNFKAPLALFWGFILLHEPITWNLGLSFILLFVAQVLA